MKSLSVVFTILLLVLTSQLARRLKQAGVLAPGIPQQKESLSSGSPPIEPARVKAAAPEEFN